MYVYVYRHLTHFCLLCNCCFSDAAFAQNLFELLKISFRASFRTAQDKQSSYFIIIPLNQKKAAVVHWTAHFFHQP